MAPGYIHYGPGFVDCKPVLRPAGSDAKKDGFGMRAINTETGREWVQVRQRSKQRTATTRSDYAWFECSLLSPACFAGLQDVRYQERAGFRHLGVPSRHSMGKEPCERASSLMCSVVLSAAGRALCA